MTKGDKIADVQARVDNDPDATDALIAVYLDDAEEAIFQRMYPFGVPSTVEDVPARYERLQCRLAARYFLRNGSEGERVHNENGISRSYGSVNDSDLLQEVMQVVSYT